MMSIRKLAGTAAMTALLIPLSACAGQSMMSSDSSMQGQSMMHNNAVMVGGAAMLPSRNIVQNALNSADHEILVAAVKQAGLVETLASKGPFTVFAPTDAAFKQLPDGVVNSLMQDENRAQLKAILTYHVVPGDVTAEDLMHMIQQGGGKAVLTTVSGGTLTATMNGPMNLVITDGKGRTAHITTYDVDQANGVIHVVDKVLLPAG